MWGFGKRAYGKRRGLKINQVKHKAENIARISADKRWKRECRSESHKVA